ncbi:rhomboid family intramembrane serine protease [Moraxella sp. FZLJ2107]|uniref:rhomboid family intramembrane serine protease n=1 Tax=unclassified Moraxella TaxID=2685852 RepID=UPI0020C90C82|nr:MULTISPECIES: rhomboid family intramembrane serine protease [unclassified Moraxella]UTO05076.1 rhomboid family intramembrane serine protease [Moraxella sp. FZLJ2107]UTO21811.1 rhomboid family intramembrane serine protease [Moraxella sp. FZLJ2109]
MNISRLWQRAPITLLLILSFVGMMAYQWLVGVQIDDPSTRDLVRFGANFLPYSMTLEPWRLITSGFVHIGVLHLLFNSFAMYYFGQAGELVLSPVRFLVMFLLSVIGGGLLSNYMTWQDILAGGMPIVTAGASGGLMGIGAFLLILAVTRAPVGMVFNTKSLAMVMGLNLLMGFAIDGINNAGHIGGMITGAILGLGLVIEKRQAVRLQSGRSYGFSYYWAVVALLAFAFTTAWWVLQGEVLAVV